MGDVVNLLAIETATPACAVGVRTSEGVERTLVVALERHHTEALAPGIERLLADVGLAPGAIDRVVVDRGPGLFTGLRVGIATALGVALASGADLVGVTSLELLVYGALAGDVSGTVVCAVDGRRGQVFAQSYELDGDVRVREEPVVTTPAELVARWPTGVTFTGDGVSRYAELFHAADVVAFPQDVPPVSAALMLGTRREPTASIVPLYLREADAIANFATRERRP